MSRVYNFSAGPSMLPQPVLEKAAKELVEFGTSGQSVMEMSHRSKVYEEIIRNCEQTLRQVLGIPDNYYVMFIQGGATMQFSMVPLNLLSKGGNADYICSGMFSSKAYEEAKRLGDVNCVASSKADGFSRIPDYDPAKFNKNADYFHICYNNTIYGSKFSALPDTGSVPLVADMSSCILSEPVDIAKYGLIYAGAQKNMAPAGVTVVIADKNLMGKAREGTPVMLDYKTYYENESMYNTPPTYTIYVMKLVLEWLRDDIGGLENMKKINEEKAALLYNYLDESKLFKAPVFKRDRSMMNVTFVTGSDQLDDDFVKLCSKNGLVNIKGHRSVGGMRASIYNAMPVEGVKKLVDTMKKFEADNK